MCQVEVLSPLFPQLSRSQRDTLLKETFNTKLNRPLIGEQTQLETAAKKHTFCSWSVDACILVVSCKCTGVHDTDHFVA